MTLVVPIFIGCSTPGGAAYILQKLDVGLPTLLSSGEPLLLQAELKILWGTPLPHF
jgi:hypothetical protein